MIIHDIWAHLEPGFDLEALHELLLLALSYTSIGTNRASLAYLQPEVDLEVLHELLHAHSPPHVVPQVILPALRAWDGWGSTRQVSHQPSTHVCVCVHLNS